MRSTRLVEKLGPSLILSCLFSPAQRHKQEGAGFRFDQRERGMVFFLGRANPGDESFNQFPPVARVSATRCSLKVVGCQCFWTEQGLIGVFWIPFRFLAIEEIFEGLDSGRLHLHADLLHVVCSIWPEYPTGTACRTGVIMPSIRHWRSPHGFLLVLRPNGHASQTVWAFVASCRASHGFGGSVSNRKR